MKELADGSLTSRIFDISEFDPELYGEKGKEFLELIKTRLGSLKTAKELSVPYIKKAIAELISKNFSEIGELKWDFLDPIMPTEVSFDVYRGDYDSAPKVMSDDVITLKLVHKWDDPNYNVGYEIIIKKDKKASNKTAKEPLEETAHKRIELQKMLDEASQKIAEATTELKKQLQVTSMVEQAEHLDEKLIDAIKKLGEWKYKIDNWILSVQKAGRESFSGKTYRSGIEELLKDKAPQLLEEAKKIADASTKLPDPEDFKIDVYPEKVKLGEEAKDDIEKKALNPLQLLESFFTGFDQISDSFDSLVENIDDTVEDMAVVASLTVKSKKKILNQEQFEDFLKEYESEIRFLYEDKYWREGGWNGLMSAVNDVKKKHNIE
jgi:hypothetical protein